MSTGVQTPLQSAVQALSAILAETKDYCPFCGARKPPQPFTAHVSLAHKPACVTSFARYAIERSQEARLADRDPWALALDVAGCVVRASEFGHASARDLAEVARLRIVKLLTTPDTGVL